MEEERSFEFAMQTDAEKTATYLESLAKYIRGGEVQLSAGSESIQFAVAGDVKLEIAAETKPEKGKGSLQLELSWKTPVVKEEPEFQIGGKSATTKKAAEKATAEAAS